MEEQQGSGRFTFEMSRAPRPWAAGVRPRRRSPTRGRHELMASPVYHNPHDGTLGDACVRGGWFAAASVGDLEVRVHGGTPASHSSVSPFFTGSSPLHLQPMPAFSSKEASSLLLDDITKCLEPHARGLFADDTLRIDRYLAATKQLLLLRLQQQLQPALASKDIHDRASSLLRTAMSSLAMEICHLRVWRLDALRKSNHSAASIWESARRSCGGGSESTSSWPSSSGSFTGTSGSTNEGNFCAYQWDLCEDMSVRSGRAFSGMNYIDRKSLSIINDIAGVMIDGGYKDMLQRAIDRHCTQLVRLFCCSFSNLKRILTRVLDGKEPSAVKLPIRYIRRAKAIDAILLSMASTAFGTSFFPLVFLRCEEHIEILDINNILSGHMKESKEVLLKVWTSAMHNIISLLGEMKRQLNEQEFDFFNILKEDYFMAIARPSVKKLFKSVSSMCIQLSLPIDPFCKDKDSTAAVKPDLSKMVHVAMIYQALNYGMPTVLALFSGETKELILAEGEGLSHTLSDAFVKVCVELNHLVRSQRLVITDTGVHRATKHIMGHMQLLVQQKNMIHLMLKDDAKEFVELMAQLISSLEFMLDMNSKNLQIQGQQQMFLLNNVHYVLQETIKNTDLGLILGEGWLLGRHDQVNGFISEFLDVSWTPVMSSFVRRTRVPETLWPYQLFDKFTSSFEMTYRVQKTWKISDPMIRQKVRETISQKVIPQYRMHIENYSAKQKSARYSIENLESLLQELFEA
ncbi:hypothetical protein ACP4OV_021168 [Aristida adscensionis]